MKEKDYYL